MILADEPTGNLDSRSGAGVIDLLAGLAGRRGTTVIVATHNVGARGAGATPALDAGRPHRLPRRPATPERGGGSDERDALRTPQARS